MKIKIHRGQNQIGGNIIEITTEKTKIILDTGSELSEGNNPIKPPIEGLYDYKGFDAVFLSHYHLDHIGLANKIYKDIPIYIGEKAYHILQVVARYKDERIFLSNNLFKGRDEILIGDIRVTPILVDHSAFDAFMFLIHGDDKIILYTGDFRSNGRKSFDHFIDKLPNKIDALICEGTTVNRRNKVNISEAELEDEAVKLFSMKKGPIFVLQSSMNIDRIVTMYRASKRCHRLFLQDLYMAQITTTIGENIPNPINFTDVKAFITQSLEKDNFRYKLFSKYGKSKIGKRDIKHSNFVMCVRTSMKKYLLSLNNELCFKDGLLIYSLWTGYKEQTDMEKFIEELEKCGLETVTLHTSGHADVQTIKSLVKKVNPEIIVPIHTESAEWFVKQFINKRVIINKSEFQLED